VVDWSSGFRRQKWEKGFNAYNVNFMDEYAERVTTEAKKPGYDGRAEIHRMTSLEAGEMFPNETFDYVFIDGDHRESFVRADIAVWAPKVKPDGWLIGHDSIIPSVQRAVCALLPGWRPYTGSVWAIPKREIKWA